MISTSLISKINKLKQRGKTIGLVHGVFDVVHVGHALYFEEAKSKVDYLIASITSDKYVNKSPLKPIFKIEDRKKLISFNKSIDLVIESNEATAVKLINLIKPNFYFKGQEYKKKKNDIAGNLKKEILAVKKNKGSIYFTNTKVHSSSKIINEKFEYLTDNAKKYLKTVNLELIKNNFQNHIKNNKRILIIGDPIVDIYSYVETTGKSNKSSIISSRYMKEVSFAGGSLLVANILANFSKNVHFIYPSNKHNDRIVKNKLSKNIKLIKFESKVKFIKKKRFLDNYNSTKYFQITQNETDLYSLKDKNKIIDYLGKNEKKFSRIFIFDYGYYSVFDQLVKKINNSTKKYIINCQSNAYNFGFNLATKYKRNLILCVDEVEFRLCVSNKFEKIDRLLKKYIEKFNKFKIFIVTSGKNGCHILVENKIKFIPTVFDVNKDTIGCGDVFLSFYGLCNMIEKFNPEESALISHIASGTHANEIGNQNILTYDKMLSITGNVLK